MRWDVVALVLGWTIGLVSIPLSVVAIYSGYTEGMEESIRTFGTPLLLSIFFGYGMVSRFGTSDTSSRVRDREAFASVALGWIPVVIIGSLPFWLGGMFHGPFDEFWFSNSNNSLSEILYGLLSRLLPLMSIQCHQCNH